jgi:uncharacterized SAM-binding protein YcdF (DUF218 family)
MQRRHMASITAVFVLLGATLFLIHKLVLLAAGDFLVIQDELQPADVIHVIAGPDHRTDYGIQLYHKGYGKQIFFTGGWCPPIQGNHAEHAEARSIEQGVPPQAIAIDGFDVTSTYGEAVRLKEFIADSPVPVHSVIIVSDSLHMRRARWAYQQVLGEQVKVQMAPVPFDLSPYQRRWWSDEETRKLVKEEYLKIAYYYARYRFSWGPLKEWLVSLDQD